MRRMNCLLFVFFLMLSGVAQAADPAIDAAGAAGLKKQVDDSLQWRLDMTKVFGQGLTMEGQPDVIAKGGFYEVQLPHLAILFGPQGKLDIGPVILNVVPGSQPGAWLIQQATLPPEMTFYDAKNVLQTHISIGTQRFSGTWLPEKAMYPKMDSLVQNIKITGADKDAPSAKISALKILGDLKGNSDGTWSGPLDLEASGITVDVPGQNPVAITIDKISSHNTYDRLDTSEALKMKAIAQKSLKEGLPQTPKEKQAFMAKLLAQSPLSADSMSGMMEVDKFTMHDTGAGPQQPRRDMAFDRLLMGGASTDGQKDKSKVLVKVAFDGLRVSSVPAAFQDMMPHALNAEITVDNLPVKVMMGQFLDVVRKSTAAAADKTDAAAQAEAKAEVSAAGALLPKMMQDAGASITVQNTYMKSDSIEASLKGKIDANANSALGITGKAYLTFKGLDEAIEKMQGSAMKPGSDPHTLGYLMGLMTVQTKGAPDKAADGKSLRNYGFEVKQNGDLLLNGALLSTRGAPGQSTAPTPVMPHSHPMIPAPAPTQQP